MRTSQRRRIRSFSKGQKMEVLREVNSGLTSLSEIARKHDINPVTIYSWEKTLRETMKKPEEADIAEVLKENERFELKVSALQEAVSGLAVGEKTLECSLDFYKRDQLKKIIEI